MNGCGQADIVKEKAQQSMIDDLACGLRSEDRNLNGRVYLEIDEWSRKAGSKDVINVSGVGTKGERGQNRSRSSFENLGSQGGSSAIWPLAR